MAADPALISDEVCPRNHPATVAPVIRRWAVDEAARLSPPSQGEALKNVGAS